jgi:hypothetical protein
LWQPDILILDYDSLAPLLSKKWTQSSWIHDPNVFQPDYSVVHCLDCESWMLFNAFQCISMRLWKYWKLFVFFCKGVNSRSYVLHRCRCTKIQLFQQISFGWWQVFQFVENTMFNFTVPYYSRMQALGFQILNSYYEYFSIEKCQWHYRYQMIISAIAISI